MIPEEEREAEYLETFADDKDYTPEDEYDGREYDDFYDESWRDEMDKYEDELDESLDE